MDTVYKRPLAVFCVSMLFGIIVSDAANSLILILGIGVFLGSVMYALKDRLRGHLFICVGVVLFFLLGSLEFLLVNRSIVYKFQGYDGVNAKISGYITAEPDIRTARISYVIDTITVEAAEGSGGGDILQRGRILLSTTNDGKSPVLEYGSKISFEGRISLPSGMRNPGGFDYKKHLARKGASAVVFARSEGIRVDKGRKEAFAAAAGMKVRDSIADVIEKSLPRQQAGLLNGMLTGYTGGLSEDVRAAFSNAGLSHIMAVSGANVLFIMIPVIFLLKLLRWGKRAINAGAIVFLVFFVYITGFEPSVLRAVIMAVTVLVGQILYREPDIYTSMAFSAVLLLAVSPHMLFNIGFQLSYTATLSLVLFCKPVRELLSFRFIPGKLLDIMAATIAAQAGVLPVTAAYFNKVSLVSLVSNLLVVPLLEGITILGMAMAVLGHIQIWLSRIIGYVNCGLLSFVLYVTGISSSLPFSTIKIPTPGILPIILYYAVLWFLLLYKPKHDIRIKPVYYASAAALAAAAIVISLLVPGKLEVVFLDVGQGDSIFIRSPEGRTVLIDGGGKPGENGDRVGESVVVPFLLDMGVTRLDLVVATHGHDDHIKGLEAVLRDIRVTGLVIPDLGQKHELDAIVNIAVNKKIDVIKGSCGDRIVIDKSTYFDVLSPEAGFSPDKASLNDSSIVLKLHYGKTSVLFTGDISSVTERLLLDKGSDMEADVIKIAHHGSQYSSNREFLDIVKPSAAIISVGVNNFGHPDIGVLERLKAFGITVLRTDYDGAVVLTSDGSRISLHGTVRKEQDKYK